MLRLCRAAIVVGQFRVVRQVWPIDRLHEPTKNAVAISGDRDVQTITTAIGIGGCNPWHGGAAALAHETLHLVFGHQAFHNPKDRFVERHINELSLAAVDLEMMHCHQRTDRPVERGEGVAQADADSNGGAVREARGVTQAPHAFGDCRKAGAPTVGAVLTIARDPDHD